MENKVTADYLDEEGCLHCGICGKRKQMKVSLMGFEHVVSCLCECEVKARQELDEKMQREEAQRLLYQRKSVGLRERRFWEWKFENDNGSNQKILIARQYVFLSFGFSILPVGFLGMSAKIILCGRLYLGSFWQNAIISSSVHGWSGFSSIIAAAISPKRWSGRPITATSLIAS